MSLINKNIWVSLIALFLFTTGCTTQGVSLDAHKVIVYEDAPTVDAKKDANATAGLSVGATALGYLLGAVTVAAFI